MIHREGRTVEIDGFVKSWTHGMVYDINTNALNQMFFKLWTGNMFLRYCLKNKWISFFRREVSFDKPQVLLWSTLIIVSPTATTPSWNTKRLAAGPDNLDILGT